MIEIFGTAAVTAMMIFYALEDRGPGYTAGFAVSCAAASLYAFAIGSWPFFVIEGVWSGIAFRRALLRRIDGATQP